MKRSKVITYVAFSLIVIAFASTLFLNEGVGGRIAEVATLCTAVIGAIALFLQFKRDKEINEATFTMELWKTFSENATFQKIMLKCDDNIQCTEKYNFEEDDYEGIVSYAQWIEALSSMINREVLTFDIIDDMYNYMFFIFVNNKYVQQTELVPNKQYYQGTLKAYNAWVNYLKKHNKPILLEENSLARAFEQEPVDNKKRAK